MAKKQTFNTASLNQLISDSVNEADQFKNQLQHINDTCVNVDFSDSNVSDDYLPENEKTFAEKKDIINPTTGASISYPYIYKKIGDLIDTGNTSLQMLQSIDPDVTDASVITSTASLINALRGCLAEYTKIHNQWVKYQQQIKLEEIRLAHKKDIIKFRKELNESGNENISSVNSLIEIGSLDLVEFLNWKKEKENNKKE